MTTLYQNYALPPTRPIFKRRNRTAAVVTGSLIVSVFVLGGLASAVADDGRRLPIDIKTTRPADAPSVPDAIDIRNPMR